MTILVHFTNCPSTSEKLPLVPWSTPTSYFSESVKNDHISDGVLEFILGKLGKQLFLLLEQHRLVPSCFAIFDLEPLTLSLDFVLMYEIFKSVSFCLDRLCRLVILYLDQHAHTLHHLESLLTIYLDRLDILKEDLFEHEHVVVNLTPAGMRHHLLHLYMNPEIKELAINNYNSYRDVAVLSAGGTTFGTSFELDGSLLWS
ncbi:hypothetical protein Tco_0438269 [Tanacetum coccineum]